MKNYNKCIALDATSFPDKKTGLITTKTSGDSDDFH